ncbi:short-chain dehydrogenase/reductase SDR [Parafrankia sp. EAN1pec]|uniref:mycofactocin-coupled SDR family oxidoreductase n=1 Tax=Parafrankia sp. (strain EAN1pec) TaxID=298653 RepID=UPI0000543BEA|nr:short-chain dehydrogenase/reductase SDR [Frankia sp. EAN1pec]
MGRVEGKVAVITGAARGLGRASALRLAEEGADIIALDLAADPGLTSYAMSGANDLECTAEALRSLGRRVVTGYADVRDLDAVVASIEAGVRELGRLDLVCANAGMVSYGGVLDLTETQWRDLLDVHITGSWHTVRASAPHLIAAGGGSIVLTSSVAGLRAEAGVAHYVTAKHGLVGLMRNLAVELAPHGIRANSVHPTMTKTRMITNESTQALIASGAEAGISAEDAARKRHLLDVPWIEAIDVANAVLYLHSDEARYITGVALPVDAGACLV